MADDSPGNLCVLTAVDCRKAHAVKELNDDPGRVRGPLRCTAGGWEEVSWDAAFAEIAERLTAIRAAHGNDAVGVTAGNPIVVHELAFLYLPLLAHVRGANQCSMTFSSQARCFRNRSMKTATAAASRR